MAVSDPQKRQLPRIPVRLSGAPDVEYSAWPLTQGIPLAEGTMAPGTPVRLVDPQGKPRPTQAAPLTTWDADGGSVRWLLVDAQVDLAAGAAEDWTIEIGQPPPAPESPLRLTREGGEVRVDTGLLRFAVGGTGLLGDMELRVDGGWTAIGDQILSLYMEDGAGRRFDSGILAPRVEIEASGPLRACICLRGHHAAADGRRFCPYVLRIHAFAGRADLRLQHTFVFDQDPQRIQLGAIGLQVAAPLGPSPVLTAGGAGQVHRGSGTLALLQPDDAGYRITGPDETSEDCQGRSEGWLQVAGAGSGLAVALAEPWREYPKGLAGDEDGIDVQIWPRPAGPLALTTPFDESAIRFDRTRDEAEVVRRLKEQPTAPLNLKSFDVQNPADLEWVEKMIERHAPKRAASHNDTGTDDGCGAAKTTEVWLRFDAALDAAEAASWAATVREPLLAPAAPAYAAGTGAYGHFYHAGDPRYATVDAGLDQIFEAVALEPQERGRLYGMMRYGNAVCSHSAGPAVAWIHYKDTDPQRALRHVGPYNNETNDQILGAWGNYLRTGRRDHWRFARAYGRCIADVAIIHAHPDEDRVGLMHYHNAHQWSGGPSPSHTLIGGILVDYYLSGDRRLLDVAREVADWAVRTQEPAGIVSCRDAALHREFTGPLWCLLEAYQATWEERYGLLAERSLHWFLNALTKPGHYPVSLYTRGPRGDEAVIEPVTPPVGHARDLYAVFAAGLRLFPSDRLRRHVLAEADYYLWEHLTDNYLTADMARQYLTERSKLWRVDDAFYWTQWGASGDGGAQIVCLAWDLTGDPLYAAYCEDQLLGAFARQAERCRHYADWRFTWLCFGSAVPRLMGVVSEARDRDAAAVDAALADWKARRRAAGRPVYEGSGVDLTVDEMDANGNILNRPPDPVPCQAPPRPREPVVSLGRLPVTPR